MRKWIFVFLLVMGLASLAFPKENLNTIFENKFVSIVERLCDNTQLVTLRLSKGELRRIWPSNKTVYFESLRTTVAEVFTQPLEYKNNIKKKDISKIIDLVSKKKNNLIMLIMDSEKIQTKDPDYLNNTKIIIIEFK